MMVVKCHWCGRTESGTRLQNHKHGLFLISVGSTSGYSWGILCAWVNSVSQGFGFALFLTGVFFPLQPQDSVQCVILRKTFADPQVWFEVFNYRIP